jgi:hypothetical protein
MRAGVAVWLLRRIMFPPMLQHSGFNKKHDGPAIIHLAGHTREPHWRFQIEGRLQPGFAARKSKMVVLGVAALLLVIPAGAPDLCQR